MCKKIKTIFVMLILVHPLFGMTKVDSKGLDRLQDFFEKNQYRQANDIKVLIKTVNSQKGDDFKLSAVRSFYSKIKKNNRFKPQNKKYVLKEIKAFYQELKRSQDAKLVSKKKQLKSSSMKASNLVPINLRPIHIKSEPITKIISSNQGVWKKNFIIVGSMIFTFLGAIIAFLLYKNSSLQNNPNHYAENYRIGEASKELDHSILNTLLKVSTAILPQNSYVLFDFKGVITRFSANMKNLVGGHIEAGMKWSDIVEKHFHKIGDGAGGYYISLHNTEKFYTANTKSVQTLGLNICQFVEVDKEMVTQTQAFRDHYYLENPCSLVDLFENALVDTSSFRDFNLVDNVVVESSGVDVSFQSETDIENLFLSLGQMIKYVYEDEAPYATVHFDTFKERHIINLEFKNYQFGSFSDVNAKDLMGKIEDIKVHLSQLGGSIVVKNMSGMQNTAIIQIIFDQIMQRDISVEDEFELQVL